jgi:hypothetical protein
MPDNGPWLPAEERGARGRFKLRVRVAATRPPPGPSPDEPALSCVPWNRSKGDGVCHKPSHSPSRRRRRCRRLSYNAVSPRIPPSRKLPTGATTKSDCCTPGSNKKQAAHNVPVRSARRTGCRATNFCVRVGGRSPPRKRSTAQKARTSFRPTSDMAESVPRADHSATGDRPAARIPSGARLWATNPDAHRTRPRLYGGLMARNEAGVHETASSSL